MRTKVVLVAFADQLAPDWVASLTRFPADALVVTGPAHIAAAAQAAFNSITSKSKGRVSCAYFALSDTSFEAVLDALNILKSQMPKSVFFINVDAASNVLSASAIAAALSNGAYVGYTKNESPAVLEPVKYSYCTKLSLTKQRILCALNEEPASSLRQLASRVGLPLSLASYHVHGDARSEGLSQMRMLQISREAGRLKIGLAPLGRVYLKGCCAPCAQVLAPQQVAAKTAGRRD